MILQIKREVQLVKLMRYHGTSNKCGHPEIWTSRIIGRGNAGGVGSYPLELTLC